jgi:penicillin amidase
VELLLTDTASGYYDDKRTEKVESLSDIVRRAYKEASDSLKRLNTSLEWYKVKNTTLNHLAKIPAFSYDHLKIGGWNNTINAVTSTHGPSWRMIVEMDDSIQAYAIYPGGQSGNPGSPHYGDYIDKWVNGQYNPLHFVTTTTKNPFKYTWTLRP